MNEHTTNASLAHVNQSTFLFVVVSQKKQRKTGDDERIAFTYVHLHWIMLYTFAAPDR